MVWKGGDDDVEWDVLSRQKMLRPPPPPPERDSPPSTSVAPSTPTPTTPALSSCHAAVSRESTARNKPFCFPKPPANPANVGGEGTQFTCLTSTKVSTKVQKSAFVFPKTLQTAQSLGALLGAGCALESERGKRTGGKVQELTGRVRAGVGSRSGGGEGGGCAEGPEVMEEEKVLNLLALLIQN